MAKEGCLIAPGWVTLCAAVFAVRHNCGINLLFIVLSLAVQDVIQGPGDISL